MHADLQIWLFESLSQLFLGKIYRPDLGDSFDDSFLRYESEKFWVHIMLEDNIDLEIDEPKVYEGYQIKAQDEGEIDQIFLSIPIVNLEIIDALKNTICDLERDYSVRGHN